MNMKSFKQKKHVLFDLDGVISDNSVGIINGVIHAMKFFSLPIPLREELLCFIGPPLKDAFSEYCRLSDADAERAVSVYREYYRERGMLENVMYDGVPDLLASLYNNERKLYVATSKPEEFARKICAHFGININFEYIGGATFDGKRGKKSDVIRYVINKFNIQSDDALMIGDRHHDVSGAKECGIECIGVLYGFGSRAELESTGAVAIAESVGELQNILQN